MCNFRQEFSKHAFKYDSYFTACNEFLSSKVALLQTAEKAYCNTAAAISKINIKRLRDLCSEANGRKQGDINGWSIAAVGEQDALVRAGISAYVDQNTFRDLEVLISASGCTICNHWLLCGSLSALANSFSRSFWRLRRHL